MKLFFSLALIGLFTSFSAQETITYPYNPDGDVDGAIASPDLLDILGVYGGEFSPSEIQIDGVGLLQVIQDLQNQIGSLQGEMLDANYVESTFTAIEDNFDLLESTVSSLQVQVAQQQQLIESLESAMNQSDPQIIDYMVVETLWELANWDGTWIAEPGDDLQQQVRFYMADNPNYGGNESGGWQPFGGVSITGDANDPENPRHCHQTMVKYSE